AAADQLQAWGSRVGAEVVRGDEGADPASVAFDAVDKGIETGGDVVVVDITGIALTKLDGTAKGGIVFRVQQELGVPVKLVGLGEGPDDLAPFEPAAFVDALLG